MGSGWRGERDQLALRVLAVTKGPWMRNAVLQIALGYALIGVAAIFTVLRYPQYVWPQAAIVLTIWIIWFTYRVIGRYRRRH